MALVVNKTKDRYTTTVKVKQAGSDTTESFSATFKKLTQSEFQKLMSAGKLDREITDEVLLGWKGIKDDEGNEISFDNDEEREMVLQISGFCGSIVAKMVEDNTGGRIKNS